MDPPLSTQTPAPSAANAEAVLDDVARMVQAEVQRAGGWVSCARLAQFIVAQHPWLAADWAGRGAFRKFLDALDMGQLKVAWNGTGGVVEDPHARRSSKGAATAQWGASQHLLAVVRPVHIATGMPSWRPRKCAVCSMHCPPRRSAPFALSDTGKRCVICARKPGWR